MNQGMLAVFGVLFAAQVSGGVGWPLVLAAASVLSSGFIVVLSLKYGYGQPDSADLR